MNCHNMKLIFQFTPTLKWTYILMVSCHIYDKIIYTSRNYNKYIYMTLDVGNSAHSEIRYKQQAHYKPFLYETVA